MIETDGTPTIANADRPSRPSVRVKPVRRTEPIPAPDPTDAWPLRHAVDGLHLPDLGGLDVGRDGRPIDRTDHPHGTRPDLYLVTCKHCQDLTEE